MSFKEPLHEIAHLAITELFTPKFDESLRFFTDLLGMSITEQEDGVAYLRAYEDRYHHSLKLTASNEAGIGAVCWRTTSPQALERRVAELQAQGIAGEWVEGHKGYGRAYEFKTTSGHRQRLFWDVEYYKPADHEKSRLLSRMTRRPNRGVPVRRLDHINLMSTNPTADGEMFQNALGFRKNERAVMGDTELACWLSTNPLVHEVAFTIDQHSSGGRLHHVAFWYGNPGQMLDIADLLAEEDIQIEAGPARHGISQAYFMYVYEPGGNRIELFGDQGYLIFDPEWQCLTWDENNFMKDGAIWFGGELPPDFFIYGTPIVEEAIHALRVAKGEVAAPAEMEPAE